jgi:thymidylate synthase
MDFLSEEYQYLNTLHKVAQHGVVKPNRTANKTKSIFGNMMRFTLFDEHQIDPKTNKPKRILPLLTTKNMSKSADIIFKELEFFIRGQTDNKILQEKGVKIWDANGSREFLDSVGLKNNKEGDLGAIYGYQWRHFGAEYKNCDTDYSRQGVDQLQNVIDEIKKNPYSRRLLVTAWNPTQLKQAALPPCHVMFQFNTEPNEVDDFKPYYLSCMLFQRSADLPLGVPFNIASYAALTHIIADLTGLTAKELIYTTADTHIYEDQINLVPGQIFRKPYPFPNLEFDFGNDPKPTNIDEYKAEHLKVVNYQCWPNIVYPFSV